MAGVSDRVGALREVTLRARQTLVTACGAHALHDGYTDAIYVLLPVWQTAFGLDYAALAALRGVYTGMMASLQIPAGRLAEGRLGLRVVLALGTALSAIGYIVAGVAGGLVGLLAGLALSGIGASTQHPLASEAVSRAYGGRARGPLGTYNFAGDLGKATLPAAASLLLTILPWRGTLWALSVLGFAMAAIVATCLPEVARSQDKAPDPGAVEGAGRGGFATLLAIGVLDSSVRMGLLTFLPFVLRTKGAGLPMVGFAFTLVFMGGAAGKFACGYLGARLGVLWTVAGTETATAGAILALLVLPLHPALSLLPVLGVMLNGTSSVLYGTVPELAARGRTHRAFALFYTGTIGSGAVSPILYGWVGDLAGVSWAIMATAAVALATLPFAFTLAPRLGHQDGTRRAEPP